MFTFHAIIALGAGRRLNLDQGAVRLSQAVDIAHLRAAIGCPRQASASVTVSHQLGPDRHALPTIGIDMDVPSHLRGDGRVSDIVLL
jgi:hypothetical protein